MRQNTDRYIVRGLIIGSLISIILLFVWDCGTSIEIQELTMNPINVDFSMTNIDINSLIQSLLSAVIGFTLTIIFIELLLSKSRQRENEIKKQHQLDNITKLLRVPLMRYTHATMDLITENGEMSSTMSLPLSVDFYGLAGLFEPSSQMRELLRPKIVVFSESVEHLRQSVSQILLNTDMSVNQDFLKLLADFLVMEDACNPCHDLLNYQKLRVGDKPFVENIKKDILGWHLPLEKIGYSNELTPVLKLKGFIEHTNAFVAKMYEVIPEANLTEERLMDVLQNFIHE